jgi:pyruvate/2-oxoglutarate dehydrogenase complex dihydrolipoamide dehydrogenase (E3) component
VIGAGTAGLVTAAGAAGLGARVALIERELMGGDCLNVGCVPSKAIISAARMAANLRDAGECGINVSGSSADFGEVMRRMRRLRAQISPMDSAKRFTELGVDVFFGQGSFIDGSTIRVTRIDGSRSELKFKKAVIATGARASVPSIPGLESVNHLTNESLFSLTDLPKRFGIIGAGPIGAETAQAFARLGSQVFLFNRSEQILPREDRDAAEIVQEKLIFDGVQLVLGNEDMKIEAAGPEIRLTGKQHGHAYKIVVDQLLIATGRTPNTEGLGLESAGVVYDGSGVQVNDFLQTTNRRVYAAGDICSQFKFTHAADFQARMVVQNSLFALGPLGRKRASRLLIPWTTYTAPEIAHVGLYPHEAELEGTEIDTYTQSFEHIDRAILEGRAGGFVKVHTRKGTDQIVGATIVAENAGDLISQISLAMNNKIGLSKIGATIHPYPTQAEAIRKLGDQYNRTRLTPLNKNILATLMRLNVGR